ncbi:MAG: FAD-binding oxidoreductase, partial [Alphaproteobacteria bacterium]|nr:FAD-binding oxidoreductase [Alphaproteobacteria bacterium]
MEGITGTRFYQRGVRVDGNALVHSAAMMRGLGETLLPNVALYEDTPVIQTRAGGGFTLVCPEFSVRAPKLIIA